MKAVLDTYLGEYNRIAWQNGGLAEMSTVLDAFSDYNTCIGYTNVVVKVGTLVMKISVCMSRPVQSISTNTQGLFHFIFSITLNFPW